MVVDPGACAVTRPAAVTEAMDGSRLPQVNDMPGTGAPDAERATASRLRASPTSSVREEGWIATEAMGAELPPETETNMVARCPSASAVIVAEPSPVPVTRPLAETVATPGLLLFQVKFAPDTDRFHRSKAVAESCTDSPRSRETLPGRTS